MEAWSWWEGEVIVCPRKLLRRHRHNSELWRHSGKQIDLPLEFSGWSGQVTSYTHPLELSCCQRQLSDEKSSELLLLQLPHCIEFVCLLLLSLETRLSSLRTGCVWFTAVSLRARIRTVISPLDLQRWVLCGNNLCKDPDLGMKTAKVQQEAGGSLVAASEGIAPGNDGRGFPLLDCSGIFISPPPLFQQYLLCRLLWGTGGPPDLLPVPCTHVSGAHPVSVGSIQPSNVPSSEAFPAPYPKEPWLCPRCSLSSYPFWVISS